ALHLRHRRQQRAGLGDDVTPRLQPELAVRLRGADLRKTRVDGREVERPLAALLGNAQASAQVEVAQRRKILRRCDQLATDLLPVLRRKDTAAGVGVEPDDLRTASLGEAARLL